ncbi:MAG TPA: DUF2911 domain-containing protein [Terriglobia bacterium]|nr:DUF2911 domain-containing protein [Terriglobia bacterium]
MRYRLFGALLAVAVTTTLVGAQDERPASPEGSAAAEVGGKFVPGPVGPVYRGGKWIEIIYGRPLKRGRDVLGGSGSNYGKIAIAGGEGYREPPVWRAGANQSTRLKTEVPLVINNKRIAPGEYTMFIDLKPGAWTLIVSSWPAQSHHDPSNKQAIWGAFGYTPDKDVVRAPMTLMTLPFSMEQLTWAFTDMSDSGGKIALMWDKDLAAVPFKVEQGS